MARNVATTVENNFVLGLITERTELRFPQNAATDMDNCVVDLYGRVSRRPGFDLEPGFVATTLTVGTDEDVFTEFVWEGVNGDSGKSFLVQQAGRYLRFFDISSSTMAGANLSSQTIDLNTYVPTSSGENPAVNGCQYASGFGKCFVVNAAIDPIYLTYNAGDETITATEIQVKIRDFEGVDDGLELTERPAIAALATLKTSNPDHYYNLLNQGWFAGDALSQWDTARTDMPSNADIVGLYRGSATDAFDNAIVTSKSPGNTYAPKGHFILDAFNPSRTDAMVAEGFTGATVGSDTAVVDRTLGTDIGDMTGGGGLAACFDGVSVQTKAASAQKSGSPSFAYVGKNYTAASGSTIAGAQVVFPSDWNENATMTVELYAKASAPSSSTDGTLLGTTTTTAGVSIFSTTFPSAYVSSSDTTTVFNYFWVRLSGSGFDPITYASEVTFYSTAVDSGTVVYKRPSTTTFFAGRTFFAGLDSSSLNSRIYFSRIIETDLHYGQCYSDNDPASESLSDFLPSDGGVIAIPEAGRIVRLVNTQSSIVVLATNGVWLVGGTNSAPFSASSYQVKKLSGIGCKSPYSVIDYKGTPVWWGEDGIYTTQYNPNYDSFDVVSMTEDSIKSFFLAIPVANRQYVKGAYDPYEDTLTWIFNDATDITTADFYKYNRALVLRPRSKAFYPWTTEEATPDIRGIVMVGDARRVDNPTLKFPTTYASGVSLVYAQCDSPNYKDWSTYATDVTANTIDEIDYTSYFLTGYYIHGETQRFFQGNYVFVFLDQDTQGSCFMKTIYDWTTSGNSGKWSPEQQIYPDWQTLQAVNYRRLKTRGKGRAMQMYFESEEGKPFSIIGWSVWESGNAGI